MDKVGAKSGGGKGARNTRVYAPTHSKPKSRDGAKSAELEAPITKSASGRYELARARWREAPGGAQGQARGGAQGKAKAKARTGPSSEPRRQAAKGARAKPEADKPRQVVNGKQKKRARRGRQETVLVPIALLGLGQSAAQAATPEPEAKKRVEKRQKNELAQRRARDTHFSAKSTARRQERPSREKRRPISGKKALAILGCMVLFIGLLFAGYFVFLLDTVIVEGYEHYTATQIVELSGLAKDRHMLLINTDAVKSGINENPYIEVLSVEKLLPRTIKIQVAERKEAAVIRSQGYDVIMDIKGHVLSIGASGRLDGLLHIYGMSQQGFQVNKPIGANEDVQTDSLRTILAQLDALGLAGDVTELNLSNPLRITMQTTEGITVHLGQAGGMEEKLLWMRDTLPSLRQGGINTGTLDVSAKGGPIYSPEGARQLSALRGGATAPEDQADVLDESDGESENGQDEAKNDDEAINGDEG